MKKVNLMFMSLLLAGMGMAFTACSSDNDAKPLRREVPDAECPGPSRHEIQGRREHHLQAGCHQQTEGDLRTHYGLYWYGCLPHFLRLW